MDIPLFGIGLQGKSPVVTSQRRRNLYYEFQPEGDRTKVSVYGTPGYVGFVSFGDTPVRGMFAVGNFMYVVHRGTFWEVDNAGVKTSRGTLLTDSGSVYFANNATQILITDGTNGYIYTIATTTFAQITDGDFPGAASVTWQDGYFIVNKPNSGKFYISAINDGINWDALDFATAESEPDNLIRVISNHGELILFGNTTTEFWGNTGALDFPYARVTTNEWGVAAVDSVAEFDNSFVYLAKNKMGEVIVARMAGYQPEKISSLELDYIINKYTSVSDAIGYSYMLGGHPMYVLHFPSAGFSWLYDGATNLWSELISAGETRHRSNFHTQFLNKNYISDFETGDIYKLSQDLYTDNGSMIIRNIRGKHFFDDEKNVVVDSLQLTTETGAGVAAGQGSNPQAMLRISRDGGNTFGNELWTTIGAIGNYLTRVIWRRLGAGRDFVFDITISDPVMIAITGTNLKARKGMS